MNRLNEIRVLKIKLNDLKRELHILKSSVANIDVLKREVHHLSRELLQERTKVGCLWLSRWPAYPDAAVEWHMRGCTAVQDVPPSRGSPLTCGVDHNK
jgi:hypothetical protein